MTKHLNLRIRGRVQGVFFRESALKKAADFGLGGFARNELDDSLYIEIEGEEASLNEFVNWCHDGPPMARVDEIEVEEDNQIKGFNGFEISNEE